jgi:hypothetical protein
VLHEIKTFIDTRMGRLRPELEAEKRPVVECPDCGQLAGIVDSYHVTTSCRFCHTTWTSEEMAGEYSWSVLGQSDMCEAVGEEPAVLNCPECDLYTFVRGVQLTRENGRRDFCFNCAETFPVMPLCANSCNTPTNPDESL